jgi:hypothetical protein
MLDTPFFPVIVPPLEAGSVKGILQVAQVGSITNDEYLAKLHDTVIRTCNIPDTAIANWTRQTMKFRKSLPGLLDALPKPQHVSSKEHKLALNTIDVYEQDLDEANDEIKRLNQLVDEIKQAKSSKEVASIIFESLPEYEQFKALVAAVKDSFGAQYWPGAVEDALFHAQKDEPLSYSNFHEAEDAKDSVDEGYLIKADEGEFVYYPNSKDRRIAKILNALQDLDSFLQRASEEFDNEFSETYEYLPRLDNKRFWRQFLR